MNYIPVLIFSILFNKRMLKFIQNDSVKDFGKIKGKGEGGLGPQATKIKR